MAETESAPGGAAQARPYREITRAAVLTGIIAGLVMNLSLIHI